MVSDQGNIDDVLLTGRGDVVSTTTHAFAPFSSGITAFIFARCQVCVVDISYVGRELCASERCACGDEMHHGTRFARSHTTAGRRGDTTTKSTVASESCVAFAPRISTRLYVSE